VLRQLGKDLQVLLGRHFGNQQDEQQRDRLAIGRIEGTGAASRRKAPVASFSPLMRPCGMATPWPRPVEPSFSRAKRLSKTVLRAMPIVFEKQPHVFENAFLAARVEVKQDVFEG
jgi:hypothetical protein